MPRSVIVPTKPKNSSKAFRKFLKSIKPWRKLLIFMVVLSIISVLFSVFGPMILGMMTTSATNSIARGEGINWSEIGSLIAILITLYIVSSIIQYIQSVVMARISAKYTKQLRTQILEKIFKLPVSYYDKVKIGDIMSRMTNDVDAVAGELANTVTEITVSVTTVFGILAMMLYISIPLSLIELVTLPLSLVAVRKIAKKAQRYFKRQREILGKLNSKIEEDYTGQMIIKANSHIPKSTREFKKTNQNLYVASWKSQFYGTLPWPVTHVFANIAYTSIAAAGGFFAISGVISIGNVQAFIQYVNRFNRPITELAQLSATIQRILAAAERVFDFLDETDEEDSGTKEVDLESVKGEVEFHDVSFGYDKEKAVIEHFSANIKPGMQVAIVGPTGAGKTTIVNLLMRFYDPDSGYITIDGEPITEMKRNAVREMFGMVLQDTWLFSGTIYDNLRYGISMEKENSHKKKINDAIKVLGVDHFIESLPDGLDTVINEDSDNISAGEKQLLTIARVLVSNPPMIILDEATSNVDTRTEQLIQNAFSKLTEGRTSFVIAHRLSTIRNADLILVMKDGNIVEQGKHNELLKLNGFYAELYNSQFAE